ncbi:MAG: extracellular solute-binding protein [Clostridiales bacterium]|nr:extracellular solute-binding protein [Clostridiales bacterium]
MKKKISMLLSLIVLIGAAAGCSTSGNNAKQASEGQTVITIANWPSEEDEKNYETMQKRKEDFEAENPDIKIETSTYVYATDTFLPKAMAGQLPTLYQTYYTEVAKIIDAGYAADITDMMESLEMKDALSDNVKTVVEKDGRCYAIPIQLYLQGIICNVEIFKEAGLVDADGVPVFPQDYDELVATAKTIKEKTGKAGFALPTTSNQGGWHFMNIAWANGVEFMAKENGKWVAKFDSQECYEALQYVKDLKWKHDVLPTNVFMTMTDLETQLATDQLAMYFRPADASAPLIDTYGMSKDNIAQCRVPQGKAGRIAQMGGTVYMIANNATPEQQIACGKWLDFIGTSPRVTEESKALSEKDMQTSVEKGYTVGIEQMPIWITEERRELTKQLNEKYCNINKKFFEDYEKYDTVILRPEEPQKCQELYSLIDSCIQAVLTDQNADPKQLIHQAAVDFQTNYLDKISADAL